MCGRGALFAGLLAIRDRCPTCGADLRAADPGDGPAVFAIFLLGAVFAGAALILEAAFRPPYWVHAVLWPPLLVAGTLFCLRLIKALLVALQFHHDAGEAREDGDRP